MTFSGTLFKCCRYIILVIVHIHTYIPARFSMFVQYCFGLICNLFFVYENRPKIMLGTFLPIPEKTSQRCSPEQVQQVSLATARSSLPVFLHMFTLPYSFFHFYGNKMFMSIALIKICSYKVLTCKGWTTNTHTFPQM